MTKLDTLLHILEDFEEVPSTPEPTEPEDDSPKVEVFYYTNNKTGKLFISFDQEKLINPLGKELELDDELYTETETPDLNQLTDLQKQKIKGQEAKAGIQQGKELLIWNGLNITRGNKENIEAGKSVAVVAFGKNYNIIDTSELDPKHSDFKSKVIDKVHKHLQARMMVRGQGRTKYRIISPFIK